MTRLLLLSSLLGAVACSGSGSGSSDAGSLQPKLSSLQPMIFTPTCAVSGCHDGATKAGNLSLETADTYAELVGVKAYGIAPKQYPDGGYVTESSGGVDENLCSDLTTATATVPLRVAAGDPTNSYLVWKLTGKDASGAAIEETTSCSQMPKVSGVTLTADQIAAVQTWITNGASND